MSAEFFLREKFREYYKRTIVAGPPDISAREFGFGEFGKKISSRHLAFAGKDDLNNFLQKQAPFYISYSAAYYELPAARPMEAKNFLKSDLIYEFDADDIRTDCKLTHDSWKCSCGAGGRGAVTNCSKCGLGVKVDEWVCPECIGAVKKQVFLLLDFLEKDFGISEGLFFNYSGSKGFHIHVRSGAISHLSNNARIELVDFLTAHELDFEKLGFVLEGKKLFSPKFSASFGWGKKILLGLIGLLNEGDSLKLSALGGVSQKSVEKMLAKKDAVVEELKNGSLFAVTSKNPQKFWLSLVEFVAEKNRLFLDRQTSIDASKIIRVPNTIHGSTGLLAKEFLRADLAGFDALSDCVIFSAQPVKLKSVSSPRFYLGKQWWGPFDAQVVQLPEFVAVYLLAKGHAQLE